MTEMSQRKKNSTYTHQQKTTNICDSSRQR